MAATTQPDYANLLAEARIAALRALTDILAKADDPKERRLAAAAILRAPDAEPPPQPGAPAQPTGDAHAPLHAINQAIEHNLAKVREILAESGDDTDSDDEPTLENLPSLGLPPLPSPFGRSRTRAANLAATAGRCPPT